MPARARRKNHGSRAGFGLGATGEYNPLHARRILALTYGYSGRPDECLAELAIATRLNPRDQNQNAIILSITGLCHLMAKRFGEAVEFERRAVQARPSKDRATYLI